MRIALVTCRERSNFDEDVDHDALVDAVNALGADASWVAWDASDVPWASFDRVVLRSPWNYHLHREAFLRWVDETSCVADVRNPADVVRWNTDKRYLGDLEAAGFGVVPTAYVEQGSRASLATIQDERGWADVVVKPTVSCGSFETHRFHRDEARPDVLEALSAERALMVQPYLREVEGEGERAIVALEGRPSHAVRKSPRFRGGVERVDAVPLAADEAAFARSLLHWTEARFSTSLVYGRVDVIRRDGQLFVMELELTEPSLYLSLHGGATEVFAQAIVRNLASGSRTV